MLDEQTLLDVDRVAKMIGAPVGEWPGNCHAIAERLLDAGLVAGGKLRRGHWLGPIAPHTMFAGRPIVPHSWLEYADEDFGPMVVDPTRWVFEDKPAYIYHAPDFEGWYDLGGDVWRRACMRPPPEYNPDERQIPLPGDYDVVGTIETLLDPDGLELGVQQVVWLANVPKAMLGDHIKPIYQWIADNGLKAAIPIDNWNYVMND